MSAGLEVVIEGSIYQHQSRGGISRLFSEILPRMCEMDESLCITLLTEGKLKQTLPEHSHITRRAIPSARRYLRPGRLWKPIIPPVRRFVRRLWIGHGEGQIWHSTYFTLPESWDGMQVVTVHDLIYERFTHLFDGPINDQLREQKRRCVQAADAVICVSKTTCQDVQHFYGLDINHTCVISPGCSDVFRQLEPGRDGLEVPTREPFLLYVGARPYYKNFDGLAQAYSAWSHRKEVALFVVGRPWSADEERYLVKLGIRDRVHLLTDIDDEELCRLYNRAVSFVHPSLYEGFGITLLEAMASGCPVVASRIPSTVEVAGECPVYFEPTDVESLLAAFDLSLSEGRNSWRVQTGLDLAKRFTWHETSRQTLGVYHALSNSR